MTQKLILGLIFLSSLVRFFSVAAELPGTLPGNVVVDNRGSASYAIPIEVVPGSGGVEPKLALQYSSMAGSGYIGVGWVLSGMSTITRIPSNHYLNTADPTAEAANYDDSKFTNYPIRFDMPWKSDVEGQPGYRDVDLLERFALDGNRLVLTSSGDYGSLNSEYRTEIDQFAQVKVTSLTPGNEDSPYEFEVRTKDGLIMTYGGDVDSTVANSAGHIVVWALRTVRDTSTNGNTMTFEYHNNTNPVTGNGDFRPNYINYSAGNKCRVDFVYDISANTPAADKAPSYIAGVRLSTQERLSKIQIKETGLTNPVREYILEYKSSSDPEQRSRLESVQLSSGSDTLPKTEFVWQEKSEGFTVERDGSSGYDLGSWFSRDQVRDGSTRKKVRANVWQLDIDGDGILEFAKGEVADSSSDTFARIVYKFENNTYAPIAAFNGVPDATKFERDPENSLTTTTSFADINGDGRSDMIIHELIPDGGTGGYNDPRDLPENGTKACFKFKEYIYAYLSKPYTVNNKVVYRFDISTPIVIPEVIYDGDDRIIMENPSGDEANADLSELPYIRMVDINGDGRSDIVKLIERPLTELPTCSTRSNVGDDPPKVFYKIYLSTGSSFEEVEQNTGVRDNRNVGINNSHNLRRVSLADYNGDGMADMMLFYRDGDGSNDVAKAGIFYSDGKQFVESTASYLTMGDYGEGSANALSGDVNGDGLLDIVYVHDVSGTTTAEIFLSTGAGFSSRYIYTDSAKSWEEEYRPMLADVNGDGKSDLVLADHFNDHDRFRIIYAHGFPEFTNSPIFSSVYVKEFTNLIWADWREDISYMISDIDADGITDFYRLQKVDDPSDPNNELKKKLSLVHLKGVGLKPDILTEITNGLGAKTKISYKPLTDESVYTLSEWDSTEMPHGAITYPYRTLYAPYYVVSSLEKDDGLTATANTNYTTEYNYADGIINMWGRGFLGFCRFISYDIEKSTRKEDLLRYKFPYTGMAEKSRTIVPNPAGTPAEIIVSVVENSFTYDHDENSGTPEVDSLQKTTSSHTYFPFYGSSSETNKEISGEYANDIFKKTETYNWYDAFGNNVKTIVNNYRESDDLDLEAKLTTTNTYGTTDAEKLLGRLTESTTTSFYDSPNTTQDSTIVKESKFTYYDNPTIDGTDQLGFLHEEIIEPDNTADKPELKTAYSYDAYGNILTKTLSGDDFTSRVTTYTYDSDGRYTLKTINPETQYTENTKFKAGFGLVEEVEGINGLVSKFTYDAFGRQLTAETPDGTITTTTYSKDFTGDTHKPTAAVMKVTTSTANNSAKLSPDTTVYTDRLGRELRSVTQNGNTSPDTIYVDTTYDALGRVTEVTEPYIGTKSAVTSTTYDVFDRPLTATLDMPDGHSRGDIVTKFEYNGFETTETRNYVDGGTANSENQKTTTLTDAKGQVIKVTDNDDPANVMRYIYDASGNLLSKTGGGSTVSMAYNIRGFKTSMSDPDMGDWSYTYYATGELKSQTDAAGNVTTMLYDRLGRMTQRTIDPADGSPDQISTWEYDNTGTDQVSEYGVATRGKLILENADTMDDIAGESDPIATLYRYDDKGRVITTTQFIAQLPYTTTTTYENGRVKSITYPSTNTVTNSYDANGFVTNVEDDDGHDWFTALTDSYDQYGRLVKYRSGDALMETSMSYEEGTGYLTNSHSYKVAGGDIMKFAYQYDNVGNIKQRTHDIRSLTETFIYDKLNRLTESKVGTTTITVGYDPNGNITSKSDVQSGADYKYESGRPHAVTSIGTGAGAYTYSYDANGNVTERNGHSIWWTAFNKPRTIFGEGGDGFTFYYDANHNRVMQTAMADGTSWSKFYIGSLYEEEHKDGNIEARHYIPTPAGVVGVWIENSNPALGEFKNYTHNDHLGSASVITNAAGNNHQDGTSPLVEYSYDSWGNARDYTDWVGALSDWPEYMANRGYTGHEMLEELELIHMNARIYDPVIGKFLSPDTYIQFEHNLQSYNRYSYVINNPLRYTDPSGHFISAIFSIARTLFTGKLILDAIPTNLRPVFLTAVQFVPGGQFIALAANTYWAYQAGGLKAAVITVATAAVTSYIGGLETFQGGWTGLENELLRATIHGVTQGVATELQGGEFRHGFYAGAAGSLAGHAMFHKSSPFGQVGTGSNFDKVIRSTIAAAAGGTASELGGGKFSNGAMSAAMTHLFNAEGGGDGLWSKVKSVGSKARTAMLGPKDNPRSSLNPLNFKYGNYGGPRVTNGHERGQTGLTPNEIGSQASGVEPINNLDTSFMKHDQDIAKANQNNSVLGKVGADYRLAGRAFKNAFDGQSGFIPAMTSAYGMSTFAPVSHAVGGAYSKIKNRFTKE